MDFYRASYHFFDNTWSCSMQGQCQEEHKYIADMACLLSGLKAVNAGHVSQQYMAYNM